MTLEPQTKPRRLFTCHRHSAEPVTGFCASCLRERLAGLDSSAQPESSSSTSITTTAAASESIILSTSGGGGKASSGRSRASAAASCSLQLELRRCKSYSASKCGSFSGVSEPRRKSCDVRARNTLWHLFNLDDEENGLNRGTEVESKNLGFSEVTGSAFESRVVVENGDKIRVSEDTLGQNVNVSEQRVEEFEEEQKTMKEHIELEWQSRKRTGRDLKDIAGSFWFATSVFSQKLRKWRLKQRVKKRGGGQGSRSRGGDRDLLPAEKLNGRQLRETQSEVGDYGYGRRSCDTDPRFSIDAGRMSLDDPRFSFDAPRASWDGYMVARTIPRLAPMLSVIDNVMMPPINKSEYGVSVEEQMNSIIEDETTSGGSAQTRDYCSDSSSSQRQNSFDCSSSGKSSNKKTVAVEVDEMNSMSKAKGTPTTVDVFHRMKFVVRDRDMKDSDFNSLKFDHSESFESASKDATSVAGGDNLNGFKKSGRWRKAWNILGFMHRLGDTKDGEIEGNAVGHPPGDCIKKQNGEAGGLVNGASSGTLARSGSCVSSRSSNTMIGSYHRSFSVAETRGYGKKSREESALERNRIAGYSPSNFDNGLLRFHLTPSWNGRRKSGTSRLKNSHSIARSVLRMN